jgi:hypothetical protein
MSGFALDAKDAAFLTARCWERRASHHSGYCRSIVGEHLLVRLMAESSPNERELPKPTERGATITASPNKP